MVADIIWEADEDCDGKNTYEEFCKMYQRCQNDTAGERPPIYDGADHPTHTFQGMRKLCDLRREMPGQVHVAAGQMGADQVSLGVARQAMSPASCTTSRCS